LSNYKANWRLTKIKNEYYVKGRIGWRGLKKSDFTTSGPYLITGQDFNNGEVDWNRCFHIPIDKYFESPEIMIEENDILLTKDGTIGKIAFIKNVPPEKASLNSHLFVIRNYIDNQIFPFFTYYLLQSNEFQKYIKIKQAGATRPGFSQQEFEEFEFLKPPLVEQRSIAEVLGTVDDAIRRTDAIIGKAEELKRGLMQRLLTKGIEHTEFKQTDLGDLPIKWQVFKFEDLVETTQLGTNDTSEDVSSGLPLIKMRNLTFGGFDFNKIEYIDFTKRNMYINYLLQNGDFLFNTRNTPELVGKSAVWHKELPEAIFNNNIMRIYFKNTIIPQSDFISYIFSSDTGKKVIRRIVDQTTSVAAIYWKSLKNLKIQTPPPEEQLTITNILLKIDEKITLEKKLKEKLILNKEGLMQILLSGGARVRLDDSGLHRIRYG